MTTSVYTGVERHDRTKKTLQMKLSHFSDYCRFRFIDRCGWCGRVLGMTIRYPEDEVMQPSIMLLRSLVHELGRSANNVPGGYGGMKLERERLGDILRENIRDSRLSEWDRDMIKGLRM